MRARIDALIDQARAALGKRPALLTAVLVALVAALCALLAWFVVYSGMSGPVQFVYDSF